jgi:protein-disulfide isomerase-like protein with CxxC motif
MTSIGFTATFDYRCPFARIAHEHIIAGLRDGAAWNVTWAAHSLKQDHIDEGEPSVFDQPDVDSGLLALEVGTSTRDLARDRFLDVHEALFDARHVELRDLRETEVLRAVLTEHSVDPDLIFEHIASGQALELVRKDHESLVESHNVWGVPTFVIDDRAVFVRLMNEPDDDAASSRAAIDRILDMLTGWPELNEFKHTTVRR